MSLRKEVEGKKKRITQMNITTPSSISSLSSRPRSTKDEAIKRGPWTPEEDEVLSEFVRREGEGRWRTLPKRAGLRRCGKSCRLRWMNYLRPSIRRGPISLDEEDLILRLHRLLGNRWSLIAGRIPGRTDNEIKNYWNTYLSKKLISQGIDPRTHRPLSNNDYQNNNNFNRNTNQKNESTSATIPNCLYPSANSNHNQIPVSLLPGEMGVSLQTEEAHVNYFHVLNVNMNAEHDAGSSWRNIEGFDGFGDEVFSSFLDSLKGDNSSDLQQQQQQIRVHENVNNGDNQASTGTNTKEIGFSETFSALW